MTELDPEKTNAPMKWKRIVRIRAWLWVLKPLRVLHTLPVKMFGLGQKVLSHLTWSIFWPILANQESLAILHENEANFFFFFRKKNFKMADWKKAYFPKSPILKNFSRKFHGLVLGLVGLNDAKPIDMAQPIWPWGCPT